MERWRDGMREAAEGRRKWERWSWGTHASVFFWTAGSMPFGCTLCWVSLCITVHFGFCHWSALSTANSAEVSIIRTHKVVYFAYFLESDQIMSIYVQIIPMMQNLRLQTAEPWAVSTEAPPTHIGRGSQSQEKWVKWRAEEAKTVWFRQRMDGWKVQCKRKRIYFN